VRRFPFLATGIVALAIAAMIGLGVWQLHRATWKEALLARYTAAQNMPPVAFQPLATDDALLFRRSSAVCLEPVNWTTTPGRNRAGEPGWRWIVNCRTGAEGPGATFDMGWSAGWQGKVTWRGGRVAGVIASRPDHRSVVGKALGRGAPAGLMIIADTPAPGLKPSAYPAIADIPNNHMAYAVQWFLFALIAAVIYGLALRWRGRGAG
jgi:cytochrome oxidase assembly protein ShyY1